jgi:DNA-binding response OmpR family regulator
MEEEPVDQEMPMSHKILIVDDEPPIIDVLTYNLKQNNYEVVVARDGEEALVVARREEPDLIILDLMLPRLDGLEVCRTLRRERDVPIIMLTARDAEVDRVVGLELGADDYVVKPFSVRELMARVKNVLRRAELRPAEASSDVVQLGELVVDAGRREARLGVVELELTPLEFELLYVLACHAGRVLSREQLLEQVWGYDYHGDLRVVDAVVKRLRAKLRQAAPKTEIIITVRGVGYKLSPQIDTDEHRWL